MPRRSSVLQIALVLAAVDAYELARRLIHPDRPLALRHAQAVLGLERALHVAWEGPLQRLFLHVPPLVDALDAVYLGAHFAVTGAFFVWLYRRAPDAYVRWRNAFTAATALALLVHWRYPVAPPRLAGTGIESTVPWMRAAGSVTDPLAAMPSLHAAWALGVGLGVALHARRRVAGALYPLVVVLATVVTGNHFLLDAVAGAAVLGAGFWLADVVGAWERVVQSPLRRGVEQSGSSPGS